MLKTIQQNIEAHLSVEIKSATRMSGGDISEAYLLTTSGENLFCKVNHKANAEELFEAEKAGLLAIENSQTIKVPKIKFIGKTEEASFLVLEYVEAITATPKSLQKLGEQLAAMHQCHGETFGWSDNNFIGSLAQANNQHKSWTDFYLLERLIP